ncbi:hypothetical protein H4S02_001121 [Coemansia sp. RSA 2611]|nr:hypothetical protein H4S02_001121 [Coemansia sp. RSA 2611]
MSSATGGGEDGGGQRPRQPGDVSGDTAISWPSSDDGEYDDDQFEDVVAAGAESDDAMPELGTVELTVGGGDDSRRKRRAVVTRRARAVRRSHHVAELISQLAAAQYMNHVCGTAEARARSLSLVPVYVVERVAAHLAPGGRGVRRDWAAADLHYFLGAFQALRVRQRRARAASLPLAPEFMRFVERRVATRPWHQAMLLACMLRALAFDARLCVGLRPPPLKLTVRESEEIERRYRDVSASDVSVSDASVLDTSGLDTSVSDASASEPAGSPHKRATDVWGDASPRYWCEVYDQTRERWAPVNAHTGAIERATQLGGAFAYIVALDGAGGVSDVTRRYARDYVNATFPQRLESVSERDSARAAGWWAQWLEPWQAAGDAREAAELARRAERSLMPRRIGDFARNPYYVLDRNLAHNEVVRPREPVGTVRGEPVFLRAHVHVLRSRMAWRRRGRVVGGDALPAKCVRARAATTRARQAAAAAEQAGHAPETELFGEWQTHAYCAPPVAGGRVPRNEYGRVDLFTRDMLPQGAAHVRDPDARRVCDALGIDCAPAVVAFEFRRGASTPVIDGVVVPSESLAVLEDALRAARQAAAAQKRADAETRALKHWRRLLVALRVRADVDASFAARSARPAGIAFARARAASSSP